MFVEYLSISIQTYLALDSANAHVKNNHSINAAGHIFKKNTVFLFLGVGLINELLYLIFM